MTGRLSLRSNGARLAKLAKAWWYFLPYLRTSRTWLSGALACGLGAVLMHLLRPWPFKLVFDVILLPERAVVARPWLERLASWPGDLLLAAICASLLGISLLWGLFSYAQAYLTARAGHEVVYALRFEAHGHLQRLSLNFHRNRQKGDLLMRLTGDINVLRDLMVDALVQGISSALLLVTMLSILLWMDWRLALVVFALLPFLALTTFGFSSRIRQAAQRQRRTEGRIAAALSETLQGIQAIQAFGAERLRDKRFRKSNRRSLRAGLRTTRLEASMSRVVEVLLAAGTAAVFWYGVRRVQAGVLSPGDLLVFVSYVHSSFRPLRRLARTSSRAAKAIVCAGRVRAILREAPDVRNAPGAKRCKRRVEGALELRRLSFDYPGRRRVLRRVSLAIEPGSFVGIVGPSGAGKSTLLALLLRLYEPSHGRIRLDGKDARRYTVESLRGQFAVVLQEPFLFGDSIRENIAFGRPAAGDVEIVRAAKAADAWGFVQSLPHGLETSLAEAGASLSAGQRQRIAVARAFLRQAPILLLDEPTTGLDAAAEAKVMAALSRLMEGRTSLMVAHKLSTVRAADRILVVRRGRIAESGSHEELLAAGGWYARTWARQAKEYPRSRVLPFERQRAREAAEAGGR